MESILQSIKKMLGIPAEYTHFDTDIIIHINTTFMKLNQMGIGVENFTITDETQTWSDFINMDGLQSVKSYVYLSVRLLFDPPASSVIVKSMEEQIAELGWRLNVNADNETEGSNG